MALRAEGLEEVLSEAEIQQKIVYLVSIWLEAAFYGTYDIHDRLTPQPCTETHLGFYLCLFVAAVTVFIEKDGLRPFPSKVFFVGNVMIFLTISFHDGEPSHT
jgi:hypothetical protein